MHIKLWIQVVTFKSFRPDVVLKLGLLLPNLYLNLVSINYILGFVPNQIPTTHTMPMVTAATGLRRTLEDPNSFVVAPGVYDGLSARIALSVGFDALYMVS